MPYLIRAQVNGTRVITCSSCGHVNRLSWRAGMWRFQCSGCKAIRIVGTFVYEPAMGGIGDAPPDLALPVGRTAAMADGDIPPTLLPGDQLPPCHCRPASPFELTFDGGTWHSGQPISFEIPDPTNVLKGAELWRDRSSGRLWLGYQFAITRMVAQPLDGTPADRVYVSRKEWLARMERVDTR